MRPLVEFMQEHQQKSAAEFLKHHPHRVLIHRLKKQADLDTSAATQMLPSLQRGAAAPHSIIIANTKAMIHLTRALSSLGPTTPQTIQEGSVLVFPIIRPTFTSPEAPLTVGRSGAALNLPFPKISKVHAYLTQEQGHSFVADAGSRNGTMVAGKLLAQGQRVEIEDGALLQFSQYPFMFFSAPGFSRLLIGD